MPSIDRRLWFVAVCLCWLPTHARAGKRIFFGDLHTHSNLSGDAVLVQVLQGIDRGPETACTYARACAQLDFFGMSDHAEFLDREAWQRSVAAVSACNKAGRAAAGPDGEPEIVVYNGFEWTASAIGKPWGHKNVFFRNDLVPDHVVGANVPSEIGAATLRALWNTLDIYRRMHVTLPDALRAAIDGGRGLARGLCPPGVPEEGCIAVARTPAELFAFLRSYAERPGWRERGYDAIVIPHGTAWGMAKLGADWEIQLDPRNHDPELQRLIEVYSGHGNSEEWRDFSDPRHAFESCNLRAARLTLAYCRLHDVDPESCEQRAREAYRTASVDFPTEPEDWERCNQCKDCFQPAERYQPYGSVQAALARTYFGPDGKILRYRFGFIAATDDHSARPGSVMEKRLLVDWALALSFTASAKSHTFTGGGRNAVEAERVASYFYPGGLVAVHAEARTREAIWAALERREVYGTSGPRIQLWFDYLGPDGRRHPMGSEVTTTAPPRFRIEAWGGPRELPGCSTATLTRWGEEIVHDVCLDACYNPSDERVGISRAEVVKITPQRTPDEGLSALIHDPYLVLENPEHRPDGRPSPHFVAEFSDPRFLEDGRDALYYVRVIQEPTPAVNGTPMRDGEGRRFLCPPDDPSDDCLSSTEERAWSSPIYVDFGR